MSVCSTNDKKMYGFRDPSVLIDGCRICPIDTRYPIPLNTLRDYLATWRRERLYDHGKEYVLATEFKSKRPCPREAFHNFYHLVGEFTMYQIDNLTVKRLTPPMAEYDDPHGTDVHPTINSYSVIETGECYSSASSHMLQSYAEFRKCCLEQAMDWQAS